MGKLKISCTILKVLVYKIGIYSRLDEFFKICEYKRSGSFFDLGLSYFDNFK